MQWVQILQVFELPEEIEVLLNLPQVSNHHAAQSRI
jgi:hypothetical protein